MHIVIKHNEKKELKTITDAAKISGIKSLLRHLKDATKDVYKNSCVKIKILHVKSKVRKKKVYIFYYSTASSHHNRILFSFSTKLMKKSKLGEIAAKYSTYVTATALSPSLFFFSFED